MQPSGFYWRYHYPGAMRPVRATKSTRYFCIFSNQSCCTFVEICPDCSMSVSASARYYKRFVRLVDKWPKDSFKSPQRDLAVQLREQVKLSFEARPESSIDSVQCEKRLQSLKDLVEDKNLKDYPHQYKTGMFGLDADVLHLMTTDEMRESIGFREKPPTLFERLFGRKDKVPAAAYAQQLSQRAPKEGEDVSTREPQSTVRS